MTDPDPSAAMIGAVHEQHATHHAEALAVRTDLAATLATTAADPNLTPTGKAEAKAQAEQQAAERLAAMEQQHAADRAAMLDGLRSRAYGNPATVAELAAATARVIGLGRDGTLTLLRAGASAADAVAAARVFPGDADVLAAVAATRGPNAQAAHAALAEAQRPPTVAERFTNPGPTYTV